MIASCRDEEAGTGPESKYARAYEARVNPFTEFQKAEAEQRVKSLQVGRCVGGGLCALVVAPWNQEARRCCHLCL